MKILFSILWTLIVFFGVLPILLIVGSILGMVVNGTSVFKITLSYIKSCWA